jgi:hypothetical protein
MGIPFWLLLHNGLDLRGLELILLRDVLGVGFKIKKKIFENLKI